MFSPTTTTNSDTTFLPSTSRLYVIRNSSEGFYDHRRCRMNQLHMLRNGILENNDDWRRLQLLLHDQNIQQHHYAITNSAVKANLFKALDKFTCENIITNIDEEEKFDTSERGIYWRR